jgi:hypothetical protein
VISHHHHRKETAVTDTNHPSHDQIAYESWVRRHEYATASNAGSGATQATAMQAAR